MTPAEHERLAILAEECGEVIHIIGKILRHGFESTHPRGGPSNRALLEKELGDVLYAMRLMDYRKDIDFDAIRIFADRKEINIKPYLHHNS